MSKLDYFTCKPIAQMLGRSSFRAAFVLSIAVAPLPALAQDVSAQNIHVDPAGQNTGTLANGLVFGGPVVDFLPGAVGEENTC